MILGLRLAVAFRFSTSWISVWLHPIGYIFALAIAANSLRRAKGKGVLWKDRIYRFSPEPAVAEERAAK